MVALEAVHHGSEGVVHLTRAQSDELLQGLGSYIATTLRGFDVTISHEGARRHVDVAVAATLEALRPMIAVAGREAQHSGMRAAQKQASTRGLGAAPPPQKRTFAKLLTRRHLHAKVKRAAEDALPPPQSCGAPSSASSSPVEPMQVELTTASAARGGGSSSRGTRPQRENLNA